MIEFHDREYTLQVNNEPIEKIELKEINQSGCFFKLTIVNNSEAQDVEVYSRSNEKWLRISPEEFRIEEKNRTDISLRVEPDEKTWISDGIYRAELCFFRKSDKKNIIATEVIVNYRMQKQYSGKGKVLQYTCKKCKAELPDRRPYCIKCRKEISREKELSVRANKEKYIFSPQHTKNPLAFFVKKWEGDIKVWGGLGFLLLFLLGFTMMLFLKDSGGKHDGRSNMSELAGKGSLSINTEPTGAWVIFLGNEVPMTLTPFKVSSLSCGKYKIHFKMDNCGGESDLHEIVVKPHVENSYSFKLNKLGSLSIQSIPSGKDIIVDELHTGMKTPSLIERINEGKHKVKLVEPSNNKTLKVYNIEIFWSETTKLFAIFNQGTSGLIINADNGSKVYIDGKIAGRTPISPCFIKPGIHKISVIKEKCVPWSQSLKFIPGEVAELNVNPVSEAKLVIDAEQGSSVFIDGRFNGCVPKSITCEPEKNIAIKVVSPDGREWFKEIKMKPGEYRRENAEFQDMVDDNTKVISSGSEVYNDTTGEKASNSSQRGASYFYNFNSASRFPPNEWKVEETIYEDVDDDSVDEMIVAFTNRRKKGACGYPVYLFAVKKSESDYEVISLRAPKKISIGEGEVYSLSSYRVDDLGYRVVEYVCGDYRGNINSSGSFAFYKGRVEMPSWMPKKIK